MQRNEIEIMAPVGCYESLHAAIEAGADSIYFGVEQLNMRAQSAANFTLEDLEKIVSIARQHGVKSYLTVNTVIYDEEIETLHRIIDRAKEAGVNAIIATDMAAILYARERGVEVHISTQSNISNIEAVRFFAQWADVMVIARELSLEQIARISQQIEEQHITGPRGELIRIEMFAHGALCMSMSGRCYLSLHESGVSANRGACRQICRRKYTVTDPDTARCSTSRGATSSRPRISARSTSWTSSSQPACGCSRSKDGPGAANMSSAWSSATTGRCGPWRRESTPRAGRLAQGAALDRIQPGILGGILRRRPIVEHSRHHGSAATKRKVYVGKVTNFFKKISVAEVLVEASRFTGARS